MTRCCKNGSVIGKMDNFIDILQEASTRASGGVRVATWSITASVWAQITPKRTNPLLEAQNKENQITHKIMIRHDPSITFTAKQRIRFGTRFMFIRNFYNMNEDDRFDILEANENSDAVVTVT